MSRKRTSLAFSWMKFRRDSTSSPISMEKIWSAAAASSMVTCRRVRCCWIHGSFPQFLVVHFAQALIALNSIVFWQAPAFFFTAG